MSAYQQIKTKFNINHKDVLVHAINCMGYKEVENYTEPHFLFGYQNDARGEKSHVILRRKHIGALSNDVGWEFLPDGSCVAHISDWDQRRFDTEWQRKLTVKYAECFVRKQAKENGWNIDSLSVGNDGSVDFQMSHVSW